MVEAGQRELMGGVNAVASDADWLLLSMCNLKLLRLPPPPPPPPADWLPEVCAESAALACDL